MKKIYRYSRDTIKNQVWENCIIESEGKIILSEIHLRRDNCEVIKQVEKYISKEESEMYKEKNKNWLVEVYQS